MQVPPVSQQNAEAVAADATWPFEPRANIIGMIA
jgi:hypothetical protein